MGLFSKPPPKKKKSGFGGIILVIVVGYVAVKDPSVFKHLDKIHPGSVSHATGNTAVYQAYAQQVFGNDSTQQGCLVSLWNEESEWNPYAVNTQSEAYGIPQALPSVQGHPYSLGDWRSQIKWGKRYIDGRYGSPCAAWDHETSTTPNWY